ncbi:uncharacterized protein LOC108892250 isoform X1 [Lates calcarifer]|uniref:Uncharacterized protein LOC108892250 isoform X1 n=1 Tax=Lates calcarifer TaxID=8187 RepID=A0AAJ7Q2V3_LATCA|nr:uncharacterized protein LOC108892250 isoform X1 [Lates calcarifer]
MKVLLLLLLYGTQQGQSQQGQSQLVEVKVDEGVESVSLPCTASLINIDSVIWNRVDLSPSTVHYRRETSSGFQDDLQNQNPQFKDRTSLNPDLLTTRDFSLSLRDVQVSDRGTYTCTVTGQKGETVQSHVLLLVRSKEEIQLEKKKQRDTAVGLGVGLPLVLALVGFLLFLAHRRGYLRFTKPSTVHEVEEGVESVKLPFKTTAHLPEDVRVEWRICASEPVIVHVNQDGTDQPDKQHQDYRGRTEMKRDLRRDLSLTLKKPTVRDSGLYVCRVQSREGDLLYERAVALWVKGRGGEERQPLTLSISESAAAELNCSSPLFSC